MTEHREYYRRHLPHWQPQGATFFVTFCLKGSLPYEVTKPLRREGERSKQALKIFANKRAKSRLGEHRWLDRWDSFLDKADFGPRWLSQPDIAEIVREALHYRDGHEYDLYAFCIMPNHVHVILKPLERRDGQSDLPKYPPLYRILQSLKRYTARRANIILGRQGAFWQDESYDHVIRDEGELLQIVRYILQNPVKAGLVPSWEDWPWTYCRWSP